MIGILIRHKAAVTLLLFFSLAAGGCGREQVQEEPIRVPTPVAMATATPVPTETQPAPPAAAATMAVPEATAPPATPAACQHDYFFEPAPETCPAEAPIVSAAAEQPFEGGVMIWLDATDSILVFFEDGRWQRFEDTWSEGEPESDPAIVPPEGFFQPIRGFGKAWRERPEIRQALGWALGVELAFESVFQGQSLAGQKAGAGQPPITYLLTFNGQVFALVQRAPNQGEWVGAADNR